MKVFLNRTELALDESATLGELLAREGIPDKGIAVAVDNKVVPKTAWSTLRLHDGAAITVIRAVCGG